MDDKQTLVESGKQLTATLPNDTMRIMSIAIETLAVARDNLKKRLGNCNVSQMVAESDDRYSAILTEPNGKKHFWKKDGSYDGNDKECSDDIYKEAVNTAELKNQIIGVINQADNLTIKQMHANVDNIFNSLPSREKQQTQPAIKLLQEFLEVYQSCGISSELANFADKVHSFVTEQQAGA